MNRPGEEPREQEHHAQDPDRPQAGEPAGAQQEGSSGGQRGPTAGSADEESSRLREERDHLADQLKRSLADVQNMRRRAAKEAEDSRRRIVEGFMHELLPVLDNFELALHAYGEQRDKSDATSLFEGIRMVESMLTAALERHGLQPIHALGKLFDPDQHEALAMEPHDDVEAGQVVRVLQSGYRLGDRVLRHAKVVVSSAAAAGQGGDAATDSSGRRGGDRGTDAPDQSS